MYLDGTWFQSGGGRSRSFLSLISY